MHDLPLRARQHPVKADARIEVDVGLVFPDAHLIGGQRVDQATDHRDPLFAGGFAPRARGQRLGPATPNLQPLEQSAHRRATHRHAGVRPGRVDQQPTRPRRTAVEKLLRRRRQNPRHGLVVQGVGLGLTVVLPPIDQPRFAQCFIAADHSADRRATTTQFPGDAFAAVALICPQDDQISHASVGVCAPPGFTLKLGPRPRVKYDPSRIHAGIPSGLVDARPLREADASFI